MATNIFTKKFNSKIAGLIVLVILFSSLSPIFAKKASAQWVVWDPGNFVPNAALQIKDYGLDAVAWTLVNLVIERMSASTVQWINRGFKGSPAFVTDPEGYFTDLGDKVAGQFIFSNPNLNFLCGPISARIKIALSQTHLGTNRSWQCTLTDVQGNMEDFLGDFEKGGWDKFFRLTQESQNNPLGAYIQAEGELFAQIANATKQKEQELSWGKGFLSWKTCPAGKEVANQGESDGDDVLNPDACTVPMVTNTPGTVIADQLNQTLGISGQKLAAADEINEIVSALLNQLVSHVVGGIGRGLRGVSSPSSTGNNQAFIEQLRNSTPESTTDYFGNPLPIDSINEAINTPIPTPNMNNIVYPTNTYQNNGPFCNQGDAQCICQNNPGSSQCLACQNDPSSSECSL